MILRSASLLVCLTLVVAGCASSANDDADDSANAVGSTSPAQPWVGDWLAQIAAKPDFTVTKPANGSPLSLDFRSASATLNAELVGGSEAAHTYDPFGRMLHFAMPTGVPAADSYSLGDDAFSSAFGDAISARYEKLPNVSTPPDYASARQTVDERRKACAAGGAGAPSPTACHMFDKQTASGQSVSTFELGSVIIYTGNSFTSMNALLRSRTFLPPTGEAPADPNAEAYAIDGVFSLGAISAINKLDKVTALTYRGVAGLHSTCAATGPKLAATPTTVDAAIARFCGYFDTVDTFRDCAFSSSSTDPSVAMSFASVRQSISDSPNPDLPIVFEIEGKTGALVETLSQFPNEHEVLFKPSVPFGVAPKTDQIMLVPANKPDVTYADFEPVHCGQPLTDDQKKRVSHFRVRLHEN